MRSKLCCLCIALLFCFSGLYAQLGIKAGVNMANEIKSFKTADIKAGFDSKNLTGYQLGLVYQAMPKKSGLGIEIAALLSQKGSSFDSTDVSGSIGYKEMNYVEMPLNLRYRWSLGFIAAYAFGGVYGGYMLNCKTVDETDDATENGTFSGFMNHVDYGYNFGAGVELFRKIQLGGTWSQGLRNTLTTTSTSTSELTKSINRVFSVNLVYFF